MELKGDGLRRHRQPTHHPQRDDVFFEIGILHLFQTQQHFFLGRRQMTHFPSIYPNAPLRRGASSTYLPARRGVFNIVIFCYIAPYSVDFLGLCGGLRGFSIICPHAGAVMRIQDDTIQAVRDRLQIEEIVGDYVSLKRRGKELMGLCPFHNERTPSFKVTPDKGLFYCFGCGKGGDAITFLKEIRGIDFTQAILEAAERYAIPVVQADSEEAATSGKKESARILLAYAADYYHQRLTHPQKKPHRGLVYLEKRGFRAEILKHFKVGYADDDWSSFCNDARRQSYGEEVILHTGLGKRGKEGLYDVLRGRIIFPIWDASGHVVAFGGRALDAEVPEVPKYINLGDTLLYKKGRHLYGFRQAKEAVTKHGFVYLVEGYLDVLAAHQAGVEHTMGVLGTALTPTQARLLKRVAKRVVLMFDGDASGLSATWRSIDVLFAEQMAVTVVRLPNGMDPCDCLIQERGASFEHQLKEQDFISFAFDTAHGANDVALVRKILSTLAKNPSPLDREQYLKACVERSSFSFKALSAELELTLGKARGPSQLSPPEPRKEQGARGSTEALFQEQERGVLKFLLRYGDELVGEQGAEVSVYEYFMSIVDHALFTQGLAGRMLSTIAEQLSTNKWRGHEHFLRHGNEEEKSLVAEALVAQPKTQRTLGGKNRLFLRFERQGDKG